MSLFCQFFVVILIKIQIEIASSNSRFDQVLECMLDNGYSSDSLIQRHTNPKLYNKLNHQWNLRLAHVYPLAYFLPDTTQDVQRIVFCGSKANIPLIPKSGGHSIESISEGNNQSIVIDFRRMNAIEIDPRARVATIQTGALIGSINYKLSQFGFGIPMGQCHTVGIGGHALGGGIGYFSHAYGLAMDNIIELEMVDAAGGNHVVSKTKNPDLFWALRGIGSGFIGIVTKFKFKVFEADRIKITFVKMNYDFNHTLDAIEGWQNWIQWTRKHEPKIMSLLQITGFVNPMYNVEKGIEIHTVHIQDEIKQRKSNQDFLINVDKIFPTLGRKLRISYPSYMELVMDTGYATIETNKSSAEINLSTIAEQIALRRYFKGKSFYVNKYFNKSSLAETVELIKQIPSEGVLMLWMAEGGAIARVDPTESAYVHRNSLYSIALHYEGSSQGAPQGVAYVQQFIKTTQFMDSGETYQNFVDLDRKDDYLERYYGKNLQKLLYTKRRWDPHNYFRNEQSLPVIN